MHTLKQLQNGELKGIKSLTLSEGLRHFPEEIFELADTLERLDLSHNKLTELPVDFGRLKKLKILFAFDNLFTVLPEVLGDCPLLDIVGFKACNITTVPVKALNPNLRWLILTNNRINNIPPEIGRLRRLEKMMLAGNRLTSLPVELSNCKNLRLLRIPANQLTELPEWLLSMPKLSWLAFSGNSFSKRPKVEPLPLIDWGHLKIQRVLGEGASGIISMAAWHTVGEIKEVAVKVFKGAMTSDGLPEDEMNICIAAGQHPGLVPMLGEIINHPEGKKGLVMGLIPKHFFNLGLTPSMESCTRDVFADDMALSPNQIVKIASTIASLAAQLHSRGIMHSDMYAHNTLIDHNGNTVFGDFGAACFYDKTNTQLASSLQRLEVSAYGYLLDDLINLCTDKGDAAIKILSTLRDACHITDVLKRPGFEEIDAELAKLRD